MALIAGLAAGAKFAVDSGEDLLAKGGPGGIEIRQVVVRNGLIDLDVVGGELRQTRASTPQLDITVRNTSKRPVLLTRARITIIDSARLAICEYGIGDAIPASWPYAIELPVLPFWSERNVFRSLHQEVEPGEADRFKLLFRVPKGGQETYAYALRVALDTEGGGKPVAAGRFVITLPDTVDRRERFLPYGRTAFSPSERLMSTWCARRNLAELSRVLQKRGRRSSSMAAFRDLDPANWWQTFADPRPPRAAAESLLRRWRTEGPILAVFAAERTGDLAFEEEVRSRAAASLLRQAGHELDLDSPYATWNAVVAARYANRFSPSRAGEEMLADAESLWEIAQAELLLEGTS